MRCLDDGMCGVGVTVGVHLVIAGLYGVVEVHGVLGGTQGWNVGEETLFLFFLVLLLLWCCGWECEYKVIAHVESDIEKLMG
jgi:hypothetical protein